MLTIDVFPPVRSHIFSLAFSMSMANPDRHEPRWQHPRE
jgi:hypothetical protein